jgi:sarcosine oxidase, subunit beta
MGASAAYHLAARGVKNIVLLEKEEFFGTGATGGARAGCATSSPRRSTSNFRSRACRCWKGSRKRSGRRSTTVSADTCSWRRTKGRGGLQVTTSNLQNSLGVGTQLLTGDEVRERLPLMRFEDAVAGTFNQKDGIVDPNSVVMGYVNAAQKMGVKAVNNAEVTAIRVSGGKVEAVETSRGEVATRLVLNAAGPWSGLIGQMAGVSLPIVPLRRQMFTTNPLREVPEDFPFVIDFAQSLYFHREGEGLLIGMSNQAEKPGFDQNVDEEFELVNLEAAIERMPLIEKASRVSHWAGLYEVTPDAHPIYGKTDVEGFLVCTGFSGHGFMHGPVSGKLMSELILDGTFSTLDISMLDLARFEEGRAIKEYNVV